jgi:hypothetical protein
MASSVAENAARVLAFLAKEPQSSLVKGPAIAEGTGLSPEDINNAAALLVEDGHAEWRKYFGTTPFAFGVVRITARGRYEFERAQAAGPSDVGSTTATTEHLPTLARELRTRPPAPVGSPFGFTDQDWESAAYRKSQTDVLYIVFGHQFKSDYYNTDQLQRNVRDMFQRALEYYNDTPGALKARLDFRPLGAGYGEHLFNEIARDIIAADIAVFDTSDLNPNVMLEMGVALTWGIRVLPIRNEGCPPPPSDISGKLGLSTKIPGRCSQAPAIEISSGAW